MSKQDGYRAVLKNKPFLSLWIAQIFSQLGDRVCFVVFVAIIAYNISTEAVYQSWLYIAFTIPAMMFTALAGVFIDRWNKKYTLITTNVLRGLIILFLPYFESSLWGIYVIAFSISTVTQFFVPAEASCIPMLVEKKHLISANSLFTTTMMGSVIFGFVLGDPLINLFGIQYVHYAITGLFVISAFCLIGVVEKKVAHDHDKVIKEFFEEFKEGLLYIKSSPIVLNAMLKLATLFSTIVALCILSISISTQWLYPELPKLGAQKFAYIVAYSGLGMVIGAFLVGKFWRKKSKFLLIFMGFAIMGLSLMILSFTGLIPEKRIIQVPIIEFLGFHLKAFDLTIRMIYTYFIATIIGFGAALVAIPVQTILQSSIPENMRGKVFGVQFTILSTSSTLPVVIVAIGADMIGLLYMLLIIGVPLLIFGSIGLYRVRKKLKNLF
ncbi:MAG: MFS transporter [Cyanobacteriota bacterium]